MPRLKLHLLGPPQVELDGAPGDLTAPELSPGTSRPAALGCGSRRPTHTPPSPNPGTTRSHYPAGWTGNGGDSR